MPESLTLESKLRALVAKVPHVYVDGPNCGWLDNSGTACGKSHDQGRHIRYGPQEEYPGYHHFEAEQVHDKSKCPTCQLEALLAERQPVCIGYPDCDGDLEGEPHSEKCPCAAPCSGTGESK